VEVERHAPALDPPSVEISFRRHAFPPGEVESFVAEHGLSGLQRGECEALCLCRGLGIPLVLTDDLAVREAAKALRIVPVGSLGVIARAFDVGLISLAEGEKRVADLYDVSSLYATRAIIDKVLERIRKRRSSE
jgi:predicted nucleic acid-binding protein